MQSLANMRVLYRQKVDEYLLRVLEKPEIYAEVAAERTPDFRLYHFMSWAFEQLTFHCWQIMFVTKVRKGADASITRRGTLPVF